MSHSFHGKGLPAFSIAPGATTPRGRLARLQQAAQEAMPTLLGRYMVEMAQADETAPPLIALIVAADCSGGDAILRRCNTPPEILRGLCAPVIFVGNAVEIARLMVPQAGIIAHAERIVTGIAELKPQPGDIPVLFAVNLSQVDTYICRASQAAEPSVAVPVPARPAPLEVQPVDDVPAPPAVEAAPAFVSKTGTIVEVKGLPPEIAAASNDGVDAPN